MDKSTLTDIAHKRMARSLVLPQWSKCQKVAATCRILFEHGHDSGLAGQITARGEQPGTYVTQRLGLGFDEIEVDNLLLVDQDLEVLEGDGMANPANLFHSWIYRARPDVQCVVHTHPIHVCALSITGTPLKIAQMDACMLYDDVAFLATWPGVPVGNSEGEIITRTLGEKRAAVLAHHGLVVACSSVEEACVVAIQCERAARMQLLAVQAGQINDLDPALAREAHDWILHEQRIEAAFHYFARRAAKPAASRSP
ncbi:aldolase [Roseateles koreensis]|uniref:Aldolase n=1 Tax=Roseateles koreensis TaxID=2987526 RepID=A0ABT5KRY0_9BURK|nr:aldolase [Roseateles koreensis]MDC8784537.1 aldolase [Roseateles koreensis]